VRVVRGIPLTRGNGVPENEVTQGGGKDDTKCGKNKGQAPEKNHPWAQSRLEKGGGGHFFLGSPARCKKGLPKKKYLGMVVGERFQKI